MNNDALKRSGYYWPSNMKLTLMRMARAIGAPWLARRWELQRVWEDVVGEKIACRAHPRQIMDDVLVVMVSDPSWAHELTYMKDDILRRLGSKMKYPPKDIRFQVGNVFEERRPPKKKAPKVKIAKELIDASIDRQALSDNPELMKNFEKMIEASYRFRKTRNAGKNS